MDLVVRTFLFPECVYLLGEQRKQTNMHHQLAKLHVLVCLFPEDAIVEKTARDCVGNVHAGQARLAIWLRQLRPSPPRGRHARPQSDAADAQWQLPIPLCRAGARRRSTKTLY